MKSAWNDSADYLTVAVFAALPVVGLVVGPSYAALVFSLACVHVLRFLGGRGRDMEFDRPLLGMAVTFIVLCWASVSWSITPARTVSAAAQASAVMAGAFLAFASARSLSESLVPVLVRSVTVAFMTGAAVITFDHLAGHPIQGLLVSPDRVATKFNRGIDYYLLILLPVLGYHTARRRWSVAAALVLAAAVVVGFGVNTTSHVSVLVTIFVLALAWKAPRMVEGNIVAGSVFCALGLPFLLRIVEPMRASIFPFLKNSAQHRLEIWDYMSARVMERPLLGWGLESASSVPIRPEELASYKWVFPAGIYPHNQFLQLWLETGMLGALLGCAFLVMVALRIGTLSPGMRPFASAAFVMAACVAFTGFQIDTDSWWAALAATAFLFRVLDRQDEPSPRGSGMTGPTL